MTRLMLALSCLIIVMGLAMSSFAAEDIETVKIGPHREIRVNDKPFFPIMSWAQDVKNFKMLHDLGINTYLGPTVEDMNEFCDAAQAAGGYAGPRIVEGVAGHRALLLYAQRDEPDLGINKSTGPRNSADDVVAVYEKAKAIDPTRPVYLNFTAYFLEGDTPWTEAAQSPTTKAYYRRAVQGADIVCFDIYPIYQRNADDKLYWVGDGVDQLQEFAGPDRPVFAWIETSKGSKWITYARQKDVHPHVMRCEVWMAIIRGATGIGYFTHAWRPVFTDFRPDAAMRAELKRTNGQITRLGPVILSAPVDVEVAIEFGNGLAGEIMAREYDGALYLFANNLDMQRRVGEATISVAGLTAGTKIEVVDEGRSIEAEQGSFKDVFGELEVHIYKIK